MKKQLIIMATLLLALAGAAQAQTWPMPGAEWTYCLYTELDQAYAKEVWKVTGDSLIENRMYDVIQPVDSLGHPIVNSGKMLLTRYENETVYRFANGKEYVYFSFNLNEGDVFTTFRSAGWGENGVPNYGNDSACCSLKPLLVTRKTEVELDGLTLNEYTLKDTLFTELYGYEDMGYWKMIDRIGPIDTYPLIDTKEVGGNPQLGFCNYSICSAFAMLSSYHDDSFEYVWSVCNPTSVDESGLERGFEIFPNPSSGIIHIESEEVAEIQVYNNLGLSVKTVKNTNVIQLEDLPAGIYMLIIHGSNNVKHSSKVVLY